MMCRGRDHHTDSGDGVISGGAKFGRAVLAISGATVLAQLIGVVAAPLLARLYSPEEYGAFFVVNSISLALAAGFALRLELAIPLPVEDDDARSLVRLAGAAIGAALLLTTVVLLLWGSTFAAMVSVPATASSAVIIGALSAAFAIFAVLNAMAVRQRRYGAIARRQLVVATLTVALQLGAGVMNMGLVGLAVSLLVAQLLGAASLLVGSSFRQRKGNAGAGACGVLRRYRRFPLFLAPAGWLNSLGTHAPLLLVSGLYAADAAGWFGLMLRLVALPAGFVGTAIAQVYVSELAAHRRARGGSARVLFYGTSKALVAAALVFGVGLAALGPWLFRAIFGSDWAVAGDMARVYALAAAAQMVASPLSQTLIVYERVITQTVWDAARLLLTIGSLVVAASLETSAVNAVWLLSVTTAGCYVINWEMCRRAVTAQQ